jgi:hypothetical protein
VRIAGYGLRVAGCGKNKGARRSVSGKGIRYRVERERHTAHGSRLTAHGKKRLASGVWYTVDGEVNSDMKGKKLVY